MAALFEPEELVGGLWHRLVGRQSSSYPSHPGQAVRFDEMQATLAVLFHGLGGDVALATGRRQASSHRLNWRQRLGLEEEALDQAVWRGDRLLLPERIALFAERERNRELYLWLCALFAAGGGARSDGDADPLRRDLAFLRQSAAATAAALAQWPGLAPVHDRLCRALLAIRPRRALPAAEAAIESAILRLLGQGDGGPWWPLVAGTGPIGERAPAGYRPFLPLPLWGWREEWTAGPPTDAAEPAGGGEDAGDGSRRKGGRRQASERSDPLLLNRFDKILSLAEMLDINRSVDDDDAGSARKALEDTDEITLSGHKAKAATKLKFDLDLPPDAVEHEAVTGRFTYPEWDCRRRIYLPDHCLVLARPAAEDGESWQPDAAARRRIARVRKQFEALRPRHEILRGQLDGFDLDLEALVRARSDLRAGSAAGDRIYRSARRQARDLAVALLVDVSLSTDSWIDDRRVLEIEKEALTVLAHGLAASGDDHAILTFTSCRRRWVRLETVKDFDEPLSEAVGRRIGALRPGYYTRMGAALRHAAARLKERPHRHKLLLVLTDGKPNDVDHYEGRHGVEDSRRAVLEARAAGLALFAVTIDREAQDYLPRIFGRQGFAIVDQAARLPAALPALYRHLISL